MAYKRYVHKKGKRHGPYYYKNVRDESGKVRSIYLGKVSSRGKKPLEVTIVFLVILLIVISALYFIQNRNLVLSRIAAEETKVPFEVDQILIKVLVRAEEHIEKELRVMNVDKKEIDIEVDVSGLSDIIDVLDKGFTIKPGQTKIVRLNFSSFNRVEGIEQAPGVYIGKILVKTDSYERDVPVIVEIESKNVLFDMNLNPVARDRKVLQGESTTFEIRVFNLQSIDSFNVGMEFFVKDTNGNTIISEKESVVVKTQASFFKTLKIPEKLKTGNYVFIAQASLGNSVGTASYLFEVEEAEKEDKAAKFIGFCRNDPLCWTLSIIVLLLIFTIGAYTYFFIGVFIYEKLFGVRISKAKKAEEAAAGKKENPIISSFKHVSERIRTARERRIKKKLEFEKQKLELKEVEEKERKLKEKEESEKKGRLWLGGKCRKLIEKGYGALGKNNLEKADNIYTKLMERYMDLSSERKAEIFKEINSFYKSLLLKKSQLMDKEEEEKKKEDQLKKEKEMERKKEQEKRLKEKERKEELRKERKKARRKKVFGFFHGLGLVKTEQEKKEYRRQKQKEKEQRELEKRGREEEKKRIEAERAKRRAEEERQREVEEKEKEQEIIEREKLRKEEEKKGAKKEYDLEKGLRELGEILERKKKEKKQGIIQRLVKREKKAEHPEEAKAKIELKKKLEGKSRAFLKCHKLLSITEKALQNNDISKAKKLYLKTRNMYIRLEYLEKKEIYGELTALYKKLSKKH